MLNIFLGIISGLSILNFNIFDCSILFKFSCILQEFMNESCNILDVLTNLKGFATSSFDNLVISSVSSRITVRISRC